MAEQRPYRLSGTAADTRLSQIKIVVLLSLGAVFVVQLDDDLTCRTALRLLAGARPALVRFSAGRVALPSVELDGLVVTLALRPDPRATLGAVRA